MLLCSPGSLLRAALVLLATSCTAPDVAPVVDVSAPVVAQPEISAAEVVRPTERPAEVAPAEPSPTLASTTPAAPEPWGAPLVLTGNSKGLEWTTTARLERAGDVVQLVLDVELHNATRKPMPVSLFPPRVSIMTTAAPGAAGEGYSGLGLRGEGMGSDVCSPGHGGPASLPAGMRSTVQRIVELDPWPWPKGQAFEVTASSSDCRPGRLTLEVAAVVVVQPATADAEPTLVPAKPSSKK